MILECEEEYGNTGSVVTSMMCGNEKGYCLVRISNGETLDGYGISFCFSDKIPIGNLKITKKLLSAPYFF